MSRTSHERPNCEENLINYSEWSIKISHIFEGDTNRELRKSLKNDILFETSYSLFFIQEKLKNLNKKTDLNIKSTEKNPLKKDLFEKNSEYFNNFDEMNFLGEGNFSLVFKAKNKKENKLFAIKKVPLNKDFNLNKIPNVELISNLRDEFVVKYYQLWTENNYVLQDEMKNTYLQNYSLKISHPIFKTDNKLLLHIKMEFCMHSLKEVIELINLDLGQDEDNFLTNIGYFIASNLLVEILECVDYLHKQNPEILHKNLKPSNILLTEGKSGRFVKITDFGIFTIEDFETFTIKSGIKYIAPEVLRKQSFSIKSDVYSIGMIIEDLFKINTEE
jgi:serine/threonine protein kinase